MALDYLLNYGVKQHTMEYTDLDVNDRLELQGQINKSRKEYFELLELLDEVQFKLLNCNKNLTERTKELLAESGNSRINSILSSDDIYTALDTEAQALKTAISMINDQIDFCKNDLRILNSVFYNKF